MKHLKLYEQFDENDPFGEEIEYVKPTFLSWLKKNYPDENKWNEITVIDCSNKNLTSLEGIENLVNLKFLYCYDNQLTSLKEIENLVNLRRLYCPNNQFTIEYKNYLRDYCKKRKIISII